MRTFRDARDGAWQVTVGKESWGTLVLLFTPAGPGDARTTILQAETLFDANRELEALTDDELRDRLTTSRPWG